MKKTIFLDRDGTLIVDRVYLNDPEQITYLPGVFDALRLLRDCGYQFIVVTNQSGIARRLVEMENLDEIHRRMQAEFAKVGVDLSRFYYAPYSVESRHPMRKPNPGMLFRGALDHGVDLKNSWMVGDRRSDVEAGVRAGCRTVFLRGSENPDETSSFKPDITADSLIEAASRFIALK